MNEIIQEPDWPFASFFKITLFSLFSFVFIRCTTCGHSLSFIVICDYLLSLVVTRCHFKTILFSLFSFVFIRCTTCCHFLSFIVICYHLLSFIVTPCHPSYNALSLDAPLFCLFINDLHWVNIFKLIFKLVYDHAFTSSMENAIAK